MKILIALSALQTVAIAMLLLQIDGLKNAWSSGALETTAPIAAAAPTRDKSDEAQLRTIVREELATWRAPRPDSHAEEVRLAAHSAIDQRAQLERVTRKLDQFRSQGAVSPAEMSSFQIEIAELEPSARRQALNTLVQAMNAGEIRGEL